MRTCVACLPIAFALAAITVASATGVADGRCTLEAGPERAVIGLIDTETLALDDGSEVRLIGALPPLSPKPDGGPAGWPPERDTRAALEGLVLGKSVSLAFGKLRTDRYGRLLAHVFLNVDGERVWLQGRLLSSGNARAYALPGLTECTSELLRHEAAAREQKLGLWSHAAYAERAASRTRELMRYRNTFQVVTGRVEKVATAGRMLYLNFGKDWREDLTVGIATDRLDAESKQRLEALAGKSVRARGWIERRNGPFIEVFDARQVEAIDNPALASEGRFPPRKRSGTAVRTDPGAERP